MIAKRVNGGSLSIHGWRTKISGPRAHGSRSTVRTLVGLRGLSSYLCGIKNFRTGKLLGIPFGQFDVENRFARSCNSGDDSYRQPVAAFTVDVNHPARAST